MRAALVAKVSFLFALFTAGESAAAEPIPLFVGTGADGIYRTQFDPESGTLSPAELVAKTPRPTFLWLHSRPAAGGQGKAHFLYSLCELGRAQGEGAAITSWSLGAADEPLTPLSRQDAQSDGPCFVAVSSDGKFASIANYGGGSVALFPIRDDGSVAPASAHVKHQGSSINPRRQGEPHAHSSRFDPTGRRLAVADLGTDKVYLYDVGDDGSLAPSTPTAIDVPAGSGPRHVVFSPDDRYLLILGELSGTITTVRYAPPSVEKVETVSTMAEGVADDAPRGSAEILFHPNGRFVYCSNRGPNEIACFDYDAARGRLKRTSAVPSGGKHPRNFRFTPDGRYLLAANQQTDNIVVFRVDQKSGELTKTGAELKVPQPMCLKFFVAD